jgi:hypothetical protein
MRLLEHQLYYYKRLMENIMRKPEETLINHLYGAEPEKVSLHVKLRYVYDESNRWSLHVVVDEMTTAVELRNAWRKIDNATKELKLWQGTDPQWYSVALMLDLEAKKKNSSDAKIAWDMNFDALVYLLWAMDESGDKNFAKAGCVNLPNLVPLISRPRHGEVQTGGVVSPVMPHADG